VCMGKANGECTDSVCVWRVYRQCVCVERECTDSMCVFITAVPITKLFAWGEGDSGGHGEWTNLDTDKYHPSLECVLYRSRYRQVSQIIRMCSL
jgi:hypothetical protein